jgi:SM-20-related protein
VKVDAGLVEEMASALRRTGYAVIDHALPTIVVRALAESFGSRHGADFDRAGVGRSDEYRRQTTIRGDLIRWLDGDDEATRWFLEWAEMLRLELNRQLFLGLFEYECHFASYPVGAFYQTHLDAFRGESNRVLSTVLYLNDGWEDGDGGELVIYDAVGDTDLPLGALPETLEVERIVTPRNSRLVVFLSEEFPHEVLPARRPRFSIAGWYRVNTSSERRPDPPSLVHNAS